MITFSGIPFAHFVVAANQANNPCFVRQRRVKSGLLGPYSATSGRSGGGDVHQPRIVADHGLTGGNQNHGLFQLGFASQVTAPGLLLAAERGDDLFAGIVIFC